MLFIATFRPKKNEFFSIRSFLMCHRIRLQSVLSCDTIAWELTVIITQIASNYKRLMKKRGFSLFFSVGSPERACSFLDLNHVTNFASALPSLVTRFAARIALQTSPCTRLWRAGCRCIQGREGEKGNRKARGVRLLLIRMFTNCRDRRPRRSATHKIRQRYCFLCRFVL